MKNVKRIAAIALALVMLFAMAIPAFALTEVPADTGSILIKDNETVLASQKTFAAHKVLDLKAYADEDGNIVTYKYSVPASLADFYATRYSLDKDASDFSDKVIVRIKAEEDLFAFGADILEAVTADAFPGAPAENGYLFTDLPLGYYVIADTSAQGDHQKPVSALILDTATNGVEIEIKAEIPPIDKKIDEDNNLNTTDDRVVANQAAIGDEVTYVITSKVPDMTGYDKYFFIIRDTMSKGLTYNNNMKLTVGNKELVANTDYFCTVTENEDDTTDIKVVFDNFIQYNTAEYVGTAVELTYTAILNKDAEINKMPNPNEVYLQYSNNPTVDYIGENEPDEDNPNENKTPIGETEKVVVETFTTTLEIVKTDPLGNRLTGAEFTLSGSTMNIVRVKTETFTEDANGNYWKLNDGSYTSADPESTIDGAPVDKTNYASLTTKYSKTTNVTFEEKEGENITITATVGEDGTVRFEGLSAGTYTIKEIEAPAGYNILTSELEVVISWDSETGFSYTGASDVDGVARVTVVNQEGTVLPSTGGIGTTIFTILGSVLALAAAILLIARKRMSSET